MTRTINHLIIIGIFLRVIGFWIPSFWYDENFTLILSRLPLDRMIAATAGDVHPPLWYLITWTISHIAPAAPPWALRIPAILFSVLSLFAFHAVMRELRIPERVQLAGMALMVLLPMQIWYAQEARMYALLEMLVLFAVLFALRGHWVGLCLATALMLYTQNYGVFYAAAIAMLVLVRDYRSLPYATASMGIAGVAFLPWVRVVLSQMDAINGRYWIQQQGAGDVLNILYKLFWASAMPSFALFSAMLVTYIALTVGLFHITHSKHPARREVLIMAFVPLALAWLASALWQPLLLHRPLIGSAPFLYIVAAWTASKLFDGERITVQRDAILACAMIIPIMVSGLGGYYRNIPAMKNDGAVSPLIETLDYVREHWQDGDVIVYADDGPMVNLSPYAADLPQYMIPACGERLNSGPVLGSLTPATRAAIGIPSISVDEALSFRRAWVFAPFSPLHPKCYEDYIATLTKGEPILIVDNNPYIFSGVWLYKSNNQGVSK